MPEIKRSSIVPFTCAQMFALVNDIERYPDFLPWCREAAIEQRSVESLTASLEIAKGGLHKRFTTCNRLYPDERIEMQLVSGPFKQLQGMWQFRALGGVACEVSFQLQFELANRLLSLSLGPIFSQIANSLVEAFSARARQLYGQRFDSC